MPVAGEEGYEKLVICPYDKAHEIRKGRLQFHLEKCRKNFPNAEMVQCTFNTTHLIRKVEIEFHTLEECQSRIIWDRGQYDVGNTYCPVKDLVPVNAATVPDGDESWDNFEAQGSVLQHIKEKAAEKDIFRMMQCESKSKRKAFRHAEHERHQNLNKNPTSAIPSTSSSISSFSGPLRRPQQTPTVPFARQDPARAIATLDIGMKNMNLNSSSSSHVQSNRASSRASNITLSEVSNKTSSRPLSPDGSEAGSQTTDYKTAQSDTSSVVENWPALSGRSSPEVESASTYSPKSTYASMSASRPSTAMSSALSSTDNRPANRGRQSIASSIEASANRSTVNMGLPPSDDGFCQIPIPGLGRGIAGRNKMAKRQ